MHILESYSLPSVADAARSIMDSLTKENIDYVRSKMHEQSPFSLLHDLCDANMLFPMADAMPFAEDNQEVADAYTDYCNDVSEAFNVLMGAAV
jgi:hypothetical protein